MNFSKTTLFTILLIIFVIIAGVFVYQWWQTKEEFPEGEPAKEEVTITTDKIECEQGEVVKYTIKNNREAPIWFPSVFSGTSLFDVEKKTEKEWIKLGYSRECFPPDYRPEPPPLIEIKSGGSQKLSWDQLFCNTIIMETEKASEGVYRIKFRYYLKPALILGEDREIHSNEFVIK